MVGTTKQSKNRKSKHTAVIERRARIIAHYCAGVIQSDIAILEDVSQATVCLDIAAQKLQWKAESLIDFDDKVNRELDKIDELERIAKAQLTKSCEDAEEVNSRIEKALKEKALKPTQGANGNANRKLIDALNEDDVEELVVIKEVTTRKVRGQSGNQAWATTIAWCIETRLKLLGLLKNEPPKPADVNISFNWQPIIQALPPEGQAVPDMAAEAIKLLENKAMDIVAIPVPSGNGKVHD